MKMFRLLSIATFVAITFTPTANTIAQNSKDKPIKVSFVRFPEKKLPDDYKTYSVDVVGYAATTAGTSVDKLASSIKMDGFKRVSGIDGNYGHLRVHVNTGIVQMGTAEAKTETRTSKDKDGKETRTTYYWYNVPFSSGASYRISDPEGNVLARGGGPSSKVIKSREYTSISQRNKDYAAIVNGMKKNYASEVVNEIVNAAQRHLSSQFDFQHIHEYPQFYMVTKWSTEATYEKYFDSTKETLEAATATTPSAEIREKLAPAMEFWSKDAAKDPGDDKKLKRVYYAANYNLALANFLTDDFPAARKHLQDILRVEGKDGSADKLIEKLDTYEARMKQFGVNTIHYQPDLGNAMPPAAVKAMEEEQAEMEESHHITEGTITMKGETVSGSFMQNKEAEELSFGAGGNTTFSADVNGELQEFDLASDDVTAFTIGERKFNKIPYSPCAKGKQDPSPQILEVVYQTDKITLYKYYPSTGALSDDKTEFALQKATDEAPVSVYDTQFLLWEQGLAKYFQDCEDLSSLCAGGTLQQNQDDLLKAARVYSELCN